MASWVNMDSTRYYYHDLLAAVITPGETCNVLVYPNPARDQFAVFCPGDEIRKIEIVNSAAAIVYTLAINHAEPVSINCSKFSRGVYFVNVQTSKGNYMRKLVVE